MTKRQGSSPPPRHSRRVAVVPSAPSPDATKPPAREIESVEAELVEPDSASESEFVPAREELIEGELLADDVLIPEGIPEPGPYLPLAEGRGVLVRRDPLSVYLAEIRRFERLSAEQEHELAVRYRTLGDKDAAARLVTSNLRLVVAVAMGFRRTIANVLDLIQEGNLGLLEAIERFDPAMGNRLSTYATWWIRSRIVKHLLDNWRLVRVGTTNARRKLLYNLRAERLKLEQMGIVPTSKLLAARLGTSEEDVVAVSLALGASDQSLDAPVGEDGTTTRGELLEGSNPSPEENAARSRMHERLHAALARFRDGLSPREKALLEERLLADEPVTLQDLASREGVTREAVRQTEARLLQRLREHLRQHLPEAAEIRFGGL